MPVSQPGDLTAYRLADAIVRFEAYAERKWVAADLGQELGQDLDDLVADIKEFTTSTAAGSDSTSLKEAADRIQVTLQPAWATYRDGFMSEEHRGRIIRRNEIDQSLNSDDVVENFMREASPLIRPRWKEFRSAIDGLHSQLNGETKVIFETARLLAGLLYVDSCRDFQPARGEQTVERFVDRQLSHQIRQQLERFQEYIAFDLSEFFDVSQAAMNRANSGTARRGRSSHTTYKEWFFGRIERLHEAILQDLKPLGSNLLAIPRWIETKRELSFGGQVILKLKNQAANLQAILNTFQGQGWPERVEVTLPKGNSKKSENARLNDARTALNKKIKAGTIRFGGDRSGPGCTWTRVAMKGPNRGRK